MFLAIPTTTKLLHSDGTLKSGSWFVKLVQNNIEMLACLNQIKVVDYRRLKNKMGDLAENDFTRTCGGFKNLYTLNKGKK